MVTYCYGRALYNRSVTRLMKTYRYVREVARTSCPSSRPSDPRGHGGSGPRPSHIDVGKLATKFMDEAEGARTSARAFVERECAEVLGRHVPPLEKRGRRALRLRRIGRLLMRLLIEKTGSGRSCACGRSWFAPRARRTICRSVRRCCADSVHGTFLGTIRVDEEL